MPGEEENPYVHVGGWPSRPFSPLLIFVAVIHFFACDFYFTGNTTINSFA